MHSTSHLNFLEMKMARLHFILKIIIILNIFGHSYSRARTVTIPHNGKSLQFNVSKLQRKVFNYVPLWTIQSDLNENRAYTYEGIVETNGIIYEDASTKAVLFRESNCKANCWEGVFGFGTKRNVISDRIKPQTEILRSLSEEKEVIYISHPVSASAKEKSKSNPSIIKARIANLAVDKYYVKLLIVVDYTLYEKLGRDVKYAIKYLDIFWTAVDLQYKNISSPGIELRITGLIIAKDDKVLNYVTKNSPDGKTVNINEVLYGFDELIGHIAKTNLTNYDAVVTMTGLEGYVEYQFGNIKQKTGSSGATYNGSICMDEYNFSVFADDGNYLGIHNAIHEVGHLLGLDHDGIRGNAFSCLPKDPNSLSVMWSRFEFRENEYWSECSLRGLTIFTNNDDESWCLKKEIHVRSNEITKYQKNLS